MTLCESTMSLLNYFPRLEKPANEQAVVDSADRPSEGSQQPSPEGGQSKKRKGPVELSGGFMPCRHLRPS